MSFGEYIKSVWDSPPIWKGDQKIWLLVVLYCATIAFVLLNWEFGLAIVEGNKRFSLGELGAFVGGIGAPVVLFFLVMQYQSSRDQISILEKQVQTQTSAAQVELLMKLENQLIKLIGVLMNHLRLKTLNERFALIAYNALNEGDLITAVGTIRHIMDELERKVIASRMAMLEEKSKIRDQFIMSIAAESAGKMIILIREQARDIAQLGGQLKGTPHERYKNWEFVVGSADTLAELIVPTLSDIADYQEGNYG